MASIKNPNGPSQNRLAARAAKARQQRRKRSAAGKLGTKTAKADRTRGARPGLMPTSGPNMPLSAKKRRKLERKLGFAARREAEATAAAAAAAAAADDDDVVMGDAVLPEEQTAGSQARTTEDEMATMSLD